MTHGQSAQHRTLQKCQRTVNFPPDSKLQASPPPCDYITFHHVDQWVRGRASPSSPNGEDQCRARGASSCPWWLERGSERLLLPLGCGAAIFRELYKGRPLSSSSHITETRKWSRVRASVRAEAPGAAEPSSSPEQA